MRRSLLPLPLLLLCIISSSPAQTIRGRVVVGESLAPVAGAAVEVFDSALVRRGRTMADASGAFVLKLNRPGRYMVQASVEGSYSALSELVDLGAGAVRDEMMLILPSPLEMLAATCIGSGAGEGATLVGVVYSRGDEVAVPGAWVTLRWEEGSGAVVRTSRADGGGRYRFCGVPVGVVLLTEAEALGSKGARVQLTLPRIPMSRADLEVELRVGASVLEVVNRAARPELGGGSALTGRLGDAATGKAVAGVVVRVGQATAITGAEGEFRLVGVAPGRQVVELEHIAYGTRREVVELEAGVESVVRVTLTPQPIALRGIDVEGERARERSMLLNSTSARRVTAGLELAEAEKRGTSVIDLVRARFPVTVEEVYVRGIRSGVCIKSNRRVMSLDPRQIPDCPMIAVVVDGVPVPNPGAYLLGLRVDEFESVEFLTALDAGQRFGLDAGGAGGALVLWSRGRGPHVSTSRNPK